MGTFFHAYLCKPLRIATLFFFNHRRRGNANDNCIWKETNIWQVLYICEVFFFTIQPLSACRKTLLKLKRRPCSFWEMLILEKLEIRSSFRPPFASSWSHSILPDFATLALEKEGFDLGKMGSYAFLTHDAMSNIASNFSWLKFQSDSMWFFFPLQILLL